MQFVDFPKNDKTSHFVMFYQRLEKHQFCDVFPKNGKRHILWSFSEERKKATKCGVFTKKRYKKKNIFQNLHKATKKRFLTIFTKCFLSIFDVKKKRFFNPRTSGPKMLMSQCKMTHNESFYLFSYAFLIQSTLAIFWRFITFFELLQKTIKATFSVFLRRSTSKNRKSTFSVFPLGL